MPAKRIVVAVALALLSVVAVLAGPWEDGCAAYNKGDCATAICL